MFFLIKKQTVNNHISSNYECFRWLYDSRLMSGSSVEVLKVAISSSRDILAVLIAIGENFGLIFNSSEEAGWLCDGIRLVT